MVDRSTVYDWIMQWKHEKTLSDKSKEGRPPSFGEKEKKDIKKLIEENDSSKHGYDVTMWDTKSLQFYLDRKGVSVSRETIRRTLSSMGGHYVKAVHEYAEADLKKQLAFAIAMARFVKSVSSEEVMSVCSLNPLRKILKDGV